MSRRGGGAACESAQHPAESTGRKTPGGAGTQQISNADRTHGTQVSTTDRTHARTGPDTQRAQAHNHTQNSITRTQPRHTSRSHEPGHTGKKPRSRTLERTYCTGKKTPGGAGTHTGHTGHTGARGHTDHTDCTGICDAKASDTCTTGEVFSPIPLRQTAEVPIRIRIN